MKENQQIHERLTSEIEQFKVIGAWCTPEFLIQSSQTREGTYLVGDDGKSKTTLHSLVAGRYHASDSPLAASGQVEKIIEELRELLKSRNDNSNNHNRNDLLEIWMSIERSLTKEEHQELSPAVLRHLFPNDMANIKLTREKAAHLGGY